MDLTTTYLGLQLKNPLVPSASPLSRKLSTLRQLEHAGAAVTMLTSELMQNGVGRLGEILADMRVWLEEHEYESLAQLRGSMSQINCAEPAAFERANYMKVLGSYVPTGNW